MLFLWQRDELIILKFALIIEAKLINKNIKMSLRNFWCCAIIYVGDKQLEFLTNASDIRHFSSSSFTVVPSIARQDFLNSNFLLYEIFTDFNLSVTAVL